MRKGLLAIALVVILVAAAAPVRATLLRAGPLEAHFTNGAALYVFDSQSQSWIPRAPQDVQLPGDPVVPPWADTVPQIGDENRSVFDVNQFLQNGVPYHSFTSGTLTGMMYDLEVVAMNVSVDPITHDAVFDYYYSGLGRNPVHPDADTPVGSGGVMQLWYDPTAESATDNLVLFDPNSDGLAPLAWVEGGAGVPDSYPTVNDPADTDASLWLECIFAPITWADLDGDGVPETPIVMQETLRVGQSGAAQSGSIAQAFLNIVGGSEAYMFDRDVYGPGLDLAMGANLQLPFNPAYTGTPQDIGNWAVRSWDPVQGNVIPEPATLTLLGLGVLGLGARIRRNKSRK